MYIVLMFH